MTWIFLFFVLISLHWLSQVDSWRAFCPLGIYTILLDMTDSTSICNKSRHAPRSTSRQRGQQWAVLIWKPISACPQHESQKSRGLFGSVLDGLSSLSSPELLSDSHFRLNWSPAPKEWMRTSPVMTSAIQSGACCLVGWWLCRPGILTRGWLGVPLGAEPRGFLHGWMGGD